MLLRRRWRSRSPDAARQLVLCFREQPGQEQSSGLPVHHLHGFRFQEILLSNGYQDHPDWQRIVTVLRPRGGSELNGHTPWWWSRGDESRPSTIGSNRPAVLEGRGDVRADVRRGDGWSGSVQARSPNIVEKEAIRASSPSGHQRSSRAAAHSGHVGGTWRETPTARGGRRRGRRTRSGQHRLLKAQANDG